MSLSILKCNLKMIFQTLPKKSAKYMHAMEKNGIVFPLMQPREQTKNIPNYLKIIKQILQTNGNNELFTFIKS